jgi:glutamate--cysteine ligase
MARDMTDITPINGVASLVGYIALGEKPKSEWKIGTEHEKFPFFMNSHQPVPYHGENGIAAILRGMQNILAWQPIMDGENIIGLSEPFGNGAISLEPGGQFELSGAPLLTIFDTQSETNAHFSALNTVTKPMGISFLGMGGSPKWSLNDTPKMPKSRYKIMADYMPLVGTRGLDMMYRTSTIQVNLDFASEQDMRRKMQASVKLQGLATALFAASPLTESKPNGLQSWRGHIWLDTDNNRAGIPKFLFQNSFGYADYVEWALDIPMYFVLRDGLYHRATDITFRQFMNGAFKGRVENFEANIGDWTNHLGTLFPDVRLKRYLEMRGADAGPLSHISALPAFWVGLLYDETSLDACEKLTQNWTYEEVMNLRGSLPTTGLKTPFRNGTLLDVAGDVLKISYAGLLAREHGESEFLSPLQDIINSGKTISDQIVDHYHSRSNHSVEPLFEAFSLGNIQS